MISSLTSRRSTRVLTALSPSRARCPGTLLPTFLAKFDDRTLILRLSDHRKSISDNCDVAVNGNTGCGVQSSIPNSYGKSFNTAGGGFYAMERTTTFIKVWFWSRNDPAVPADVKTAGATVNTDAWVSLVSS